MSTQENGNAGNTVASLPAAVNIVSSTNTNPIVVTATAHGMTTGDLVSINGHQVNTSANGSNFVTVLTVNTYSIPVAGVGVGGATGTSQSRAVGATYAIPSDGDAITAASVNVALEAVADRTAFLAAGMGQWRIAQIGGALNNTDATTQWDSFTVASLTDGAWNAMSGATVWTPAGIPIQIGDYIEVSLDVNCNLSQTLAKFNSLSIWMSVTAPGGSDLYVQIPASQRTISVGQFVNNECHPVHLFGGIVSSGAGQIKLKMLGDPADHASLVVWSFVGAYILTVHVYRATLMPQ